jgi:hypothetical protein
MLPITPTDTHYTDVTVTYAQAARRASRQFGKPGAAAYNIPGCAYCGGDALATSLQTLYGEVTAPPDQPHGGERLRVELAAHHCRKHHAVTGGRKKGGASTAGTAGLVVGAVVYFLANLVGASNNVPFFRASNLLLVVLAGLAFMAVCAVIAEWLGKLVQRRSGELPPAVRVAEAADGSLVFSFFRAACAAELEAQLRADEEQAG